MYSAFARSLARPSVIALALLGVLAPSTCLAERHQLSIISTVAGSGLGGYAGDGAPATKAMLDWPAGIAVDGAGNLYICDWSATIRKVDARTGVISTVAGTGFRGFAGDGGLATTALLGGPGDIASDRAGNIYFSDGYNNRLRRISASTGTITTIAGDGTVFPTGDGGLAVNAGIGYADGVTVDQAGNVYLSNGADKVRKIDAATGIITTVAGAGGSRHSGDGGPATLAQLAQPSGLAVDGEGNLYIAARGEHCIRKVSAATGIITTIAGVADGYDSGIMGLMVYRGGFGGDGGPATGALLNDPENIALDSAGNLYISDVMNYRIRRIDAITGIITTFAGTGVSGYGGDGGTATDAEISTPSGIAFGPDGRVYFGDLFNHRVRAITPIFLPSPVTPPLNRLRQR